MPPEALTADAVYRFCESLDAETRSLGMRLIGLHPRLAIPEELFRLTESPDRQVRAFVIRTVWSLYRDKGITLHWKPAPKPEAPSARSPTRRRRLLPPRLLRGRRSDRRGGRRATTRSAISCGKSSSAWRRGG